MFLVNRDVLFLQEAVLTLPHEGTLSSCDLVGDIMKTDNYLGKKVNMVNEKNAIFGI